MIRRETRNAGAGKTARIIAKINALVEPEIIRALYEASNAGVAVDLIVRGICCLRPAVPGVSENIRVRSIVGRFLEHSRCYCFHNGGDEECYCASADWMDRNFFRRIELMFPIRDETLKARITSGPRRVSRHPRAAPMPERCRRDTRRGPLVFAP